MDEIEGEQEVFPREVMGGRRARQLGPWRVSSTETYGNAFGSPNRPSGEVVSKGR